MRTNTKKRRARKKTAGYMLFLLPGLFYLIINNYIPMLGVFIAFKDVDYVKGIFKSDWVGLRNFKFLFATRDAAIITRNTLLYNFAFIVLGTVLAIFVAILLCELGERISARIFQSALILPYLLSWVIISYIVFALLSSDTGYLNKAILEPSGHGFVNWYGEASYWPVILVLTFLWKSTGYQSIVYMANIAGIDSSVKEAARIDGAGKLQEIRFIILPLLKPTVIIMTLMAIGRIFYSDFGLFYQVPLDSGTIYATTQTIDTYVYRGLMKLNDIGMASAAGLFQSIVGFILVLCSNLFVKKIDPDNALF